MGEKHEQAYGEGRQDAERGEEQSSERGPLETAALAASGIGLVLDSVLPGGDPKVEQSYQQGVEDAKEDEKSR